MPDGQITIGSPIKRSDGRGFNRHLIVAMDDGRIISTDFGANEDGSADSSKIASALSLLAHRLENG